MRHGHALTTREAGVSSDAERPLSALGEKEALESARHLSSSDFAPDLIISSPFLRADRTAAIAAGVFTAARRQTSAALSGGSLQELQALIQKVFSGKSRVLLIGHQPLIGAIAGFLTGAASFDVSPAGFIRILSAGKPGAGSLIEFYTPPSPEEKRR